MYYAIDIPFIIKSLGFSEQDTLLLFLCPVFSALGGIIHFFVLFSNYSKLPVDISQPYPNKIFGQVIWLIGRLFLAGAAGLIFSLYFVGALTSTPTTTARILAFSILIGYAAPKLWITQETIVTEAIENRLKKILREQAKESAASQLKE